jgi:uncharacterized repeat protein (TIGR01451 family)
LDQVTNGNKYFFTKTGFGIIQLQNCSIESKDQYILQIEKTTEMKNLTIPFLLLSGLSINGFGQSQWVQQTPKPFSGHLYQIHMKDSLKGYAYPYTGESFRILTGDGGKTWNFESFKSGALFFINRKLGFLRMGDSILRTTNSGETWNFTGVRKYFTHFSFTDSLNGFALKSPGSAASIFKTSNGGQSWDSIPSSFQLTSVKALSAKTLTELYAVHSWPIKIVRSTNGGLTWSEISIGTTETIADIKFINPQFGHACNSLGAIGITTNGGQTWNWQPSPTRYTPNSLEFYSQESGFGITRDTIFRTTNGGQTWSKKSMVFNISIHSIDMISDKNGLIVGDIGLVGKTTDGGESWVKQTKGPVNDLKSMAFSDAYTAWAVGDWTCYRSTDFGRTWVEYKFDTLNPPLRKIRFYPSASGYAAGFGFYQTHNGGISWKKSYPIPGQNIYSDLAFLNVDTGWVVGLSGGVARTFNRGLTWQVFPDTLKEGIISFPSYSAGYRLELNYFTNKSKFFKSVDGGQTWQATPGSPSLAPRLYGSLFFINANTGWTASQDGRVYRTSNGGNSWTSSSVDIGISSTHEMHFENALNGTLTTDKGIYSTIDGGISWNKMPIEILSNSYIHPVALGTWKNKVVVSAGYWGTIFTRSNWNGNPKVVASGRIVKRQNTDCGISDQSIPHSYRIVMAEPGPVYGSSDENGQFNVEVEYGNYALKQQPRSTALALLENQTCPPNQSSHTILANGLTNPIEGLNFVNEVRTCPFLVVHQSHGLLRPCMKGSLSILVQNEGNQTSEPQILEIKVPKHLIINTMSEPYTKVNDLLYLVQVPALFPIEKFSVRISDSLDCNQSFTGNTLCIEAGLPNAPACLLQSPNWDGANLEVASSCLVNGQTRFRINNKGNAMANTSQYQIFIDSALVYQAPFQLAANGSMSVTLPVNAPAGYARLVVPQSANHPLSAFASAEANCATGFSSNGLFPPPDQSPLVDVECVTITNSFDPNDKSVYPTGWGAAGNVEPETEFSYKIRFQNTGTDTAFKVVLVDTLDANLDIASLQIGLASHPYEFKVSGKGKPVLSWTFNNILLPESNTNQEKSNGFVNFSIRPKAGLALGTRLENFANIYFDFNDPIRTNTTVNTLWEPTYTPGVVDTVFVTEVKQKLAVKILTIRPNPAQDVITIQLPEGNAGLLEITDLQGRILQSTQVVSGQVISIGDLKPGVYFLKTEGYKAERLVVKP